MLSLRRLGTLRESSRAEAQLIIPNYINSQSMCLSTASFYGACCINECEGLIAKIERAGLSPAARTDELASLMKMLLQGEQQALIQTLDDLEDKEAGLVSIHTRAFA